MKMKINLNEIRMEKGLTLAQLAEMSGVSKSYIHYIESGKKTPTIDIICKLASALKVRPGKIFNCNGCTERKLKIH